MPRIVPNYPKQGVKMDPSDLKAKMRPWLTTTPKPGCSVILPKGGGGSLDIMATLNKYVEALGRVPNPLTLTVKQASNPLVMDFCKRHEVTVQIHEDIVTQETLDDDAEWLDWVEVSKKLK